MRARRVGLPDKVPPLLDRIGQREDSAGYLRTADCGLRTADCGLRTADCGLRTADCGKFAESEPMLLNSRFRMIEVNTRKSAVDSVKQSFLGRISVSCRVEGGVGEEE